MSWPLVEIKQAARVVGGATPKSDEAKFWDGDVSWATPRDLSDLDGKFVSDTPRKITNDGLRSCSAEVLPAGSVLFSSRAPIGHIAVNTAPMATNQGFKSFIPGPDLNASFLYWWLDANRNRLQAMGNGATFKEVSKAIVERIKIPLPPLLEQQRIAGILDQADALRRLRRQSLSRLSDLGQAIFYEMFGDPAQNPKKFEMRPLRDTASKFSDGPFGSNLKSAHYVETGVRVIRLQNIGVGEFIHKDKAYISASHFASLKKHECLPGDILVGTLGDPNLRACIQPEWLGQALNKADCVQIRVNLSIANNEYVCALLNTPSVERMAHDLVHGQTRARISMGRLRDLRVPIPPKDQQDRFGEVIAKLKQEVQSSGDAWKQADFLFASLQHRAFRGEL